MAELPILPLKTDALLGDTSHMTPEEFGAYMRILLALWLHGGRLPHDMKQLQRITGVNAKRWRSIQETVLRPLTIAEGYVSQKRLTATMLDVREMRRQRAIAGARGNMVRWNRKAVVEPPKEGSIVTIYPGSNQLK